MPRLTGALFQSLDGVIQAPGGPEEDPTARFDHGGWTFPFFDDSLDGPMGELFGGDFALLLGRRTYDIFAAYWPHNGDQPIGETFNRIRKYVVTSNSGPLAWNNSVALNGPPAEELARIKAADGPDLLIQGSSTLYPPLLAAGLIDRLVLMTFPVVLGRGKRWSVDDPAIAHSWRLAEHHLSATGVTFAAYEPAGPIETGTFATKPPSPEETALRQRIAEGRW